MKALVELSILAVIAVAAPALSENHYVGDNPVSYQKTPMFRREKKFSTETNDNVAQLSETQHLPRREITHVAEVSGTTIGLKKPIIDKNNMEYHLHRNADEEQAHPKSQVKCTKEVKVKVCKAENFETRSSAEAYLHHSKSDVEQNIKMANPAIEKLQQVKHDWKNNNSGPYADLHKDIKVAKQAVEHIQQNFGNLETINMQATTLDDAETLQHSRLRIAKGERAAQWMEAINNIQKNVEVARSLEDGFTAANNQEQIMEQRKSNNELEKVHNHEITIKNSTDEEQSHSEKLEAKVAEIEHKDMKSSASEMKVPKLYHYMKLHQMTSAKIAEDEENDSDFHNMDTPRVVTFDLPMSHHNLMPMYNHYNQPHFPSAHYQFPHPSHDFHHPSHVFHHPSHDFHHNFHGNGMHIKAAKHAVAQEKAAEMDNAARGHLQMNMNSLSSKSDLEHSTHFKQEQMVAARGAYGSYGLTGASVGPIGSATSLVGGSSGGPGVTGVFPHVNAGGRGISLFLSCSPSVVSGRLAKAQSGYGASAYRAGDNINLHSKRDTKNSNNVPAAKTRGTPTEGQ